MVPEIHLMSERYGEATESVGGRNTLLTDSGSKLLVPIAVVLTFIGIINSLQAFYIFYGGLHSTLNFIRFLVSNLFYCWYFILTALAVRWLSRRVSLHRESLMSWIPVHAGTLILLTVAHQISSLEVDRFVLGTRRAETVFSVLFNNPGVWGDLVVYVLFLLGFYMIEYRMRSQENEMKYTSLEMELVRTRLHELRGRIHPQFLFSTLEEIGKLVNRNLDREANKALSLLSDFLRVTVYGGEFEEVPLEEELAFVEKYMAVERIRFRERLEVKKNIDEDARKAVVPNFILQPLVEDLLMKNLDNAGARCEIYLAARRTGDSLEMTVGGKCAGGPPEGEEKVSEKNVLEISRERLAQLYPGNYKLARNGSPGEGETVRMNIPYRLSEREQATSLEKLI